MSTLSPGSGGTSPLSDPPRPFSGESFLYWAKELVKWLRESRAVAGSGLMGKKTPSGYILSTKPIFAPGEIVYIDAPIFSTAAAVDSNFADRGTELRSYYKTQFNLIPCDGQTYNTADYPALAAIRGETGTTFVLPDRRGRFTVGADSRGSPDSHSDTAYATAGAVGGFRRHGKTENNHTDHRFDIGLQHSTQTTTGAGDYAAGTPPVTTVGSADYGVTGGENYDEIYKGDAPGDSSNVGTIARGSSSGSLKDYVQITLKHIGNSTDGSTDDNGAIIDCDNRPPWMTAHAMIRF